MFCIYFDRIKRGIARPLLIKLPSSILNPVIAYFIEYQWDENHIIFGMNIQVFKNYLRSYTVQ